MISNIELAIIMAVLEFKKATKSKLLDRFSLSTLDRHLSSLVKKNVLHSWNRGNTSGKGYEKVYEVHNDYMKVMKDKYFSNSIENEDGVITIPIDKKTIFMINGEKIVYEPTIGLTRNGIQLKTKWQVINEYKKSKGSGYSVQITGIPTKKKREEILSLSKDIITHD